MCVLVDGYSTVKRSTNCPQKIQGRKEKLVKAILPTSSCSSQQHNALIKHIPESASLFGNCRDSNQDIGRGDHQGAERHLDY